MRGEHAGYLEIKLPPRNRNKRFKVWCNRWVVLHRVSDLSVAKMLAKLDIYTHAEHACFPENKISSIILENVTSIKVVSRSKTHPNAFEIREGETPVLYFSAATITETQLWVCFLREIFNLNTSDTAGVHNVWIRENDYSKQLALSGDYLMSITPTNISIDKGNGEGAFQWPLSSLKKFYLRPVVPEAKHNHILIIEPGETLIASGNFVMFVTPRAEEILMTIRTNIFIAMKQKSRNRTSSTQSSVPQYSRHSSLPQGCNNETASLCDFQRSSSIDQKRPMSVFGGTSSISVPPPKPVRTWAHIPSPSSETPSPLDDSREMADLFMRKRVLRQSSDLQIDSATALPGSCLGDENTDQKYPASARNYCGSKDSGILSCTSDTGSIDVKQQSDRSNSTDSFNSLFTDRQKGVPQTNKTIFQGFPITETASKSSESDKESDDCSGNHIYWDIEPQELSVPHGSPHKHTFSLSRSHSLQNLIPSDTNPYEELADRLKELRDIKNVPPALPKRPKSLAFQKDKTLLKTSMKERFLDYISPQAKRKPKNEKVISGADNLNLIIKDFRKWSDQEKKKVPDEAGSPPIRVHEREWTLDQQKDLISARHRRRHLHSWSVSDASDLSWNDEQTQKGVFVVERKVDPLAFLKQDPFKLLSKRQITRQSSLDIRSTTHTETDDPSPLLSPVVIHQSKKGSFGSGHWSDGDAKGSDDKLDQVGFPLNRRRSISLEGRLQYQVMIRQFNKEISGANVERSLTNSGLFLHKVHESIPPSTPTPPSSPMSPKLSDRMLGDYIEMCSRIRSISASETDSGQSMGNQENKFVRKTSLL